ncbi:Nn.00g030040.m01.CDS01 [Neocucurbitaria sp. VM-36]
MDSTYPHHDKDTNEHHDPVQHSLKDPVDGFLETPINSISDPFLGDIAPNAQEATLVRNNNHVPTWHTQTFGDAPVLNVPHHQTVPPAAQYYHHNHKYQLVDNLQPQVLRPPRVQFLRDLPAHDYILPAGGPINATMAEIIAILPNWFRNRNITIRFENNGINAGVHFAILQEYRHLNLTTAIECERARDHLSDQYRKTMREVVPGWTKAKHQAPENWDKSYMLVNGFLPDTAHLPGYNAPLSIPFRDLAIGLKKLPQGHDAADITRALDFAMGNQNGAEYGQVVDFMFPDDLQKILSYTGRATVTDQHTDPYAVRRYRNTLKAATAAKALKLADQRQQEKYAEQMAATKANREQLQRIQAQAFGQYKSPQLDVGYYGLQQTGVNNLEPQPFHQANLNASQYTQGGGAGIPESSYGFQQSRSVEQEAAATVASKLGVQFHQSLSSDFPEIPDVCRLPDLELNGAPQPGQEQTRASIDAMFTMEDMEAFLAPHQSVDYSGLLTPSPESDRKQAWEAKYSSTQLLRDCIEGNDDNNHSDLARASRRARQYDLVDYDFVVADVGFIIQMLETAGGTQPIEEREQ